MDDFSGQTIIITGATGGVGAAVATRLIECGATALLVGRSDQALADLVGVSGWRLAPVTCYAVDLAVAEEVRRFAQRITEKYLSVHVLVHAAGGLTLGTVEESSLDDFDRQYPVNVRAPYQLTQALLPAIAACHGQVVFINSSAGVMARNGVSQYAATKHALRAVADSLRDEVNERGVRVMSVFLGRTASRMQAAVHAHEQRPYRPERLVQPDDVASMVVAALQLPRTAEVTDLHIRPMLKS